MELPRRLPEPLLSRASAMGIRRVARRIGVAILLVALGLLALRPMPAPAAPGDLDPSFGDGGTLTVPPNPDGTSRLQDLSGMVIQPDGKILVSSSNGRGPVVARFNPNGTLDGTFGQIGIVADAFPGGGADAFASLAVQPDGKIVAAGTAGNAFWVVARLNPNGSFDSTFGGNGRVQFGFDIFGPAHLAGVAVQSDGKIVLGGDMTGAVVNSVEYPFFAAVRLCPDGSFDNGSNCGGPGFGGRGEVEVGNVQTGASSPNFVRAEALAVQDDGRVIVAGVSDGRFVLVRFTSDGHLDQSFGVRGADTPAAEKGIVFTGIGHLRGIALQRDGKILAAGSRSGGVPSIALVRYCADGRLDGGAGCGGAGFGSGGTVTTAFDPLAVGYALAVQPDGKIVVSGATSSDFALARYTTAGALDTTFGNGGKLTTNITAGSDHAFAVAVQPDGKVVAAGVTYDPPFARGYAVGALARYLAGVPASPDGIEALAISPTAGGDTGTATFTLYGRTFKPGAVVRLAGSAAVTAQNIAVAADGRTLTGRFDLSSRPRGVNDIIVTNPDGKSSTLKAAFTVVAGVAPLLSVYIAGPSILGTRHPNPIYLVVNNQGTLDAHDLNLLLTMPLGVTATAVLPMPNIPGIEWSTAPQTASLSGQNVLALWLYTVRGFSTTTIQIMIQSPSPGESTFTAELWQQPPNSFTDRGESSLILQSSVFSIIADSYVKVKIGNPSLLPLPVEDFITGLESWLPAYGTQSGAVSQCSLTIAAVASIAGSSVGGQASRALCDATPGIVNSFLTDSGDDGESEDQIPAQRLIASPADTSISLPARALLSSLMLADSRFLRERSTPLVAEKGISSASEEDTLPPTLLPLKQSDLNGGFRWCLGDKWGDRLVNGKPSFHYGWDINSTEGGDSDWGMPVYSSRKGKVVSAGWETAGGKTVRIESDSQYKDGTRFGYAHLAHYVVGAGQPVQAGQLIGYLGSTGTDQSHLHFGVRQRRSDGTYVRVDPATVVTFTDLEHLEPTCPPPAVPAPRKVAPRQERTVQHAASYDPNDKFGIGGAGSSHFIPPILPLPYAISFENKLTATAPAQEVVITDQLNMSKLDLSTLQFGAISFDNRVVIPPPSLAPYTTDIDLRPTKNLIVRITISVDTATGLVTWRLTSIDSATGGEPTDPLVGFLPPNTSPPQGEGSVLYTIKPRAGLSTGTEIRNKARIVFDANAPIDTPEWLNTIDAATPASQAQTLAATQTTPSFTVNWSGTDNGSGILDYTVYVSEEGGPFGVWLANTTATAETFSGTPGKTYAFYSIAQDQAGNREAAPTGADATTRIAADTSPPTTTATPTPATNANGWNNASVTVGLSATDNTGGLGVKEISYTLNGAQTGSSVVAGDTASVAVTAEGTTTLTYFARDNAGNEETAKTLTVKLDKTAPTLTFGTPTPAPNAAGWLKANVSIPFTPADVLSGVDSTMPAGSPLVLTTEGGAVTGTVTVTDKAGNAATFTSPGVKIDKTAPTTTAVATPAASAAGWNNGDVAITLSAADPLSGVARTEHDLDGAGWVTTAGAITVTAEGAHTLQYRSVDIAGNVETAKSLTIRIDKTKPTLSGAPTTSPNSQGWYTGDVIIAWACSDNSGGSGIDGACPANSTITGEGAGLSAATSVSDKAGNSATATVGEIKIDRTGPAVTVTGVEQGKMYVRGAVPAAGCTTTDTLSGVATSATAAITGGTANGVGSFTATCSGATDKAGNVSAPVKVTYAVQYQFTGFLAPVDNPPIINTVNAGRAISLKWNLSSVSAVSSMLSVESKDVSCRSLTGTQDPVDTTTTGGTSFRYDATADQFIYNWATLATWAGTCRQLTVTLDDGTSHSAYFQFK